MSPASRLTSWFSRLVICLLSASALLPAVAAHLSLVENAGQRAVYDSASGYFWYWDLSLFADKTYLQQLGQIDQLNADSYFSIGSWHLATAADMLTLASVDKQTIRETFHPSYEHYDGSWEWHYWYGRYGGSIAYGDQHPVAETAWGNFVFGPFDYPWAQMQYGYPDSDSYSEVGAWVVAVPEPGCWALLVLSGTIFRIWQRRRPFRYSR